MRGTCRHDIEIVWLCNVLLVYPDEGISWRKSFVVSDSPSPCVSFIDANANKDGSRCSIRSVQI